MLEYGVSIFIVVQYLKDFLISEGAVMIDLAKLEPVLGGYQTYFPKHWPHVEDFKWEAAQHFHDHWNIDAADFGEMFKETSVYKGYKQDKIEMRGDRAEMSDFPLYQNTVAGGLDRRDQTIGGFSFVVKIYAVPVVEIIG